MIIRRKGKTRTAFVEVCEDGTKLQVYTVRWSEADRLWALEYYVSEDVVAWFPTREEAERVGLKATRWDIKDLKPWMDL